ncbi:hypothetical protein [Paenibacillus gansuensis]|uniref:Secreted protein n=1 Tax=Paenibacillus gansuensis TaxID=306542 RepID=A0ABW5PDS5_9BACL
MKKWITLFIVCTLLLTACSKPDKSGKGHHEHESSHEEHAGPGNQAAEQVKAVWTPGGADGGDTFVRSGEETEISVRLEDSQGKPMDDYDINHEKKMHLIVVSKDLSYFNHVHPEYKGDGTFAVQLNFPNGGEYKLIADFIPSGMSAMTLSHWVTVEGKHAAGSKLQPDKVLAKEINGKQITLTMEKPTAGMETVLKFYLTDAATNEPVKDLEPYLGAVGHVVILSQDTEQYLHVHPADENTTGPEAKFATTFPKSGIYKIWGQFQHNGKVYIVPFVVDVP